MNRSSFDVYDFKEAYDRSLLVAATRVVGSNIDQVDLTRLCLVRDSARDRELTIVTGTCRDEMTFFVAESNFILLGMLDLNA
jgi:hypothetical protein